MANELYDNIELEEDILWMTTGKYKLLLQDDNGSDALVLYMHLMFTARLQQTNSVKANNWYLQKGLKWGKTRLQKAKKTLFDMGLIQEITRKDNAGKFTGKYIQVKTKSLPSASKPADGETISPSQETNALTNNINALTNNVNTSHQEESKLPEKKSGKDKTQEEKEAYKEIENIFVTGYEEIEKRRFPYSKKHGDHINNLIPVFLEDEKDFVELTRKYFKMIRTDSWWRNQPFTPACYVSNFDRIVSYKFKPGEQSPQEALEIVNNMKLEF